VTEPPGDATGRYVNPSGEFTRDQRYITTRITGDGRDGYPVEPGRYRLVVSRACPWANRAIIVRRLLGLEPVLSMAIAGPTHDALSWTFDLDPGGRDPVLGIARLREAYLARFPGYDRGITVPAIVDITTGQVVTNDYAQMTLDLSTEWRAYHRPGAPDLYPADRRDEIDEVAGEVFRDVNNGVYRCGFAGTQPAYETAYRRLFDRLDWLCERLAGQRYLVGDTITEADVRLFTTLARFDPVYHGHFKCNRQKLTELPVLWAYARDLFQTPGFGDTIDFDHIKRHYYQVHREINPTGIVPVGPDLAGWLTPHGRQSLGGRPFGDGSPLGPPPTGEVVPPEHTPRHLSCGGGPPHPPGTSRGASGTTAIKRLTDPPPRRAPGARRRSRFAP
jgi:putative glutathione S-transferase